MTPERRAHVKAAYEPEGIESIAGRDLVVVSNPSAGVVSLGEIHVY